MFRKDQLEPSLWKICRFTQMWMRLRSEGKEVELSKLISMLVSSKPFTLDPKEEQFNSDGLHVKHTGMHEEENQLFNEFLSSAVEASMTVEALSEVPGLCNGYKKRGLGGDEENDGVKKRRLTKAEEVKTAKCSELNDRDGVEAEVKRSLKTRKLVSLDNLRNSPQLEKEDPLNQVRVKDLARKMKESFDLSQITLTVSPEETENIYDENCENAKFVVISGRYRLAALKQLDDESELEGLKGCERREILCVVLDLCSPSTQSYVHKRSNKIQADVAGFRAENLIFTLAGLKEIVKDRAEAVETIRRYAVNLELAPDEVNVLKKLALWQKVVTIT